MTQEWAQLAVRKQDRTESDDEGPEEVSISTAKAQDQALMSEQKAQQALAKDTASKRRRNGAAAGLLPHLLLHKPR